MRRSRRSEVHPANVTLSGPRAAQQLVVLDDERHDVIADRTVAAKFVTANPKIAVVDDDGLVEPVGDGETAITATVDGKSATVRCSVTNAKARRRRASATTSSRC